MKWESTYSMEPKHFLDNSPTWQPFVCVNLLFIKYFVVRFLLLSRRCTLMFKCLNDLDPITWVISFHSILIHITPEVLLEEIFNSPNSNQRLAKMLFTILGQNCGRTDTRNCTTFGAFKSKFKSEILYHRVFL